MRWRTCFVADVKVPGKLQGRAALRNWYDTEMRHDLLGGAHGILGHVIDLHDADRATGLVYSRNDLETESVWVMELVAYLEAYERHDEHWSFARRLPLFWYESDITDPPLGPLKMRWPNSPRREGGFHGAFPSWDEFWAADPGRLEAPVPAPPATGDWLRTLRGTDAPPKVESTPRAEGDGSNG